MDARIEWRASRLLGRAACDFAAGLTVRCVGTKTLSRGGKVVCGFPMGTVKPGARVILRVQNPKLSPMPHLGLDSVCPDCHTSLEAFVLAADAPRLEATG